MLCVYVCRDSVINGQDKKGLTPLHYAVKKNDIEFVKVLLDNGAGMYPFFIVHGKPCSL